MESEIQAIEEFILSYFEAYFTERDLKKTLNYLSPHLTGFGTGIIETGFHEGELIDEYRRDLQEIEEPIEYNGLKIFVGYVSSHFAVVNCTFNIQTEIPEGVMVIPDLRNSFTLHKINGDWKIVLLHVSAPNDQQEHREMFPVKKIIEKNDMLSRLVDQRTKELLDVNEALRKSNLTKDTLFSIIGHDLRSPFHSMLGFVELLKNDYDKLDTHKQKQYIDIISKNSKKIYRLLDNLLVWTNIQRDNIEFNPENYLLSRMIREVIDFFEEAVNAKSISISSNCDKAIAVYCDKVMVMTVLRNLISNAVKFTPENGSIELSVTNEQGKDDMVTVSIQDSGIGLKPDQFNGLFEFGKVKPTRVLGNDEGFGIGLSLCKEFIDIHETTIWADTDMQKGCKISFNLKRA